MVSRGLVGAVALALLGAGCATMPSAGDVHLGREVVGVSGLDDSDVRVLPPAPTDGESPAEVVHGFLVASRNAEDDHAIAREYLAPSAAVRWQPGARVTSYDERSLDVTLASRAGKQAVVTVRAERIGLIDAAGGYTPAAGTLVLTVHVALVGRQWRIIDPPAGLLLSTLDVARSFRAADVYYLDPAEQVVVPDRVFLQVPRRGLTTALVRALLDGASTWLAPAVRSAFPSGTKLLGNVPVNDGVADVDLSREVLRASGPARAALSAQLVWTLRQLSEVSAVRVLADGTPLPVPGVTERQSREAWGRFAPDVLGGDAQAFYADGKVLRTGDGAVVEGPLGRGEIGLRHPAVSADLTRVAGITSSADGVTLWVGRLTGRPTPRLSAAAMTPPCFDRSGGVWTVTSDAAGRQRVVVVTNGGWHSVPASGLFAQPVQQLRLSRDGARVAAVVGSGATSKLLVGRVVSSRDGLSVGGFREVLPAYDDLDGLAWADAAHLVVLGRPRSATPGTRRTVVRVDVDGYTATQLARLDVQPESVAAAPGRPALVAGDGQVWTSVLGMWRSLGPGTDPVYPD